MRGLIKRHYINLYYFKRIVNVGDIISPFVVSKLSGCKIKYKNPRLPLNIKTLAKIVLYKNINLSELLFPFQKCLIALGSILHSSNKRCLIWGAGFREYESIWHGGDVYAVRGYLSRKKLPQEYQNVAIGDPAILLPLLIPVDKPSCNERCKIGIIPHYLDFDDLNNRFSSQYEIIDVRTKDIIAFVKHILSCDYILSSSLHGLIVSHSYGVPALWIYKNYIDSGPFKFHDYFSSVDIPIYDGFRNLDEILKDEESCRLLFNKYVDYSLPHLNISTIQKNLLDSFPYRC